MSREFYLNIGLAVLVMSIVVGYSYWGSQMLSRQQEAASSIHANFADNL